MFTRKKRIKNIMLALEATCRVGRSVATTSTNIPVKRRAVQGVFRFLEIFEKKGGNM
jgi:hypothetical protein